MLRRSFLSLLAFSPFVTDHETKPEKPPEPTRAFKWDMCVYIDGPKLGVSLQKTALTSKLGADIFGDFVAERSGRLRGVFLQHCETNAITTVCVVDCFCRKGQRFTVCYGTSEEL